MTSRTGGSLEGKDPEEVRCWLREMKRELMTLSLVICTYSFFWPCVPLDYWSSSYKINCHIMCFIRNLLSVCFSGNAVRARTASNERQAVRTKAIERQLQRKLKAAQQRVKPVRKPHPAILKRYNFITYFLPIIWELLIDHSFLYHGMVWTWTLGKIINSRMWLGFGIFPFYFQFLNIFN